MNFKKNHEKNLGNLKIRIKPYEILKIELKPK